MRSARAIRDHLAHPVIDIDAHVIEFMPVASDYLRDALGPKRLEPYRRHRNGPRAPTSTWPSLAELHDRRPARYAWCGLSADTLDRATAMLPALLHERLGELGIDYTALVAGEPEVAKRREGGRGAAEDPHGDGFGARRQTPSPIR